MSEASPVFVREITAQAFQREVVDQSMTTPVLLDFWAAWCGPCRTLGPVLEKLAKEYAGAFVLGKVDADREQDLAYAFGVQGIPFCVLVAGGRPVDGFQGALPEAEVRKFLERNGIAPAAAADAEAEKEAEANVDPNSPEQKLLAAVQAAELGDAAAARQALEGIPEDDPSFDRAARLRSGLEWLDAKLSETGPAAERYLHAARTLFVHGDIDGAMEQVLASVAEDKGFRQGLARKAMLLCFAVVGEGAEALDGYRRRLATLLY